MYTRCLAIIFVFCITATASLATTCINWKGLSDEEFQRLIDANDAIFFGEVIDLAPTTDRTQIVSIRVKLVWKGKIGSNVELIYQGASESFEREIGGIGTQKVFYTSIQPNGDLTTTYCGLHGIQETTVDERMKTYLGEGQFMEQTSVARVEQTPTFFSRLWNWLTSIFKSS